MSRRYQRKPGQCTRQERRASWRNLVKKQYKDASNCPYSSATLAQNNANVNNLLLKFGLTSLMDKIKWLEPRQKKKIACINRTLFFVVYYSVSNVNRSHAFPIRTLFKCNGGGFPLTSPKRLTNK